MRHHYLLTIASSLALSAATYAQCPDWADDFNAPGAEGAVYDQITHNDGSGVKLYIGGQFESAGTAVTSGVAMWDGSSWHSVGGGPGGTVFALAFYDDGTGEKLYAGGREMLAIYDGVAWTSIPVTGDVRALHVHDDGSGPALFAGGRFFSIDGVSVSRLARYDGTWTNMLGGVLNGDVNALASFDDDGLGEDLYFAGRFSAAGGVSMLSIGRWDGTGYSALGDGVDTTQFSDQAVMALQPYVDGLPGNRALYVGGSFSGAGGFSSPYWARYSPVGWQPLPNEMGWVTDMALQRTAAGTVLWTSGYQMRSWDGTTVTELPRVQHDAYSIAGFAVSGEEQIYVGSDFGGINQTLHGIEKNPLVRWNGSAWEAVGSGNGIGSHYDSVAILTTHDFGDGPELVAGGKFNAAGGNTAPLAARFDGDEWVGIGANLTGWRVSALVSFDDGSGPALYAGGNSVGDDEIVRIALRYNGTDWDPLGPPMGSFSDDTFALAVFDEGAGDRLFAAGDFTSIGGVQVRDIARWNGTQWTALGGGLTGGGTFNEGAALAVYNDGSGEALYVGGRFLQAGGVNANHIARWDGSSWSALGQGIDGLSTLAAPLINAMCVWNSPSGQVLVVTGYLDTAGGQPANCIATWDGSSWSALGSGLEGASLPAGFAVAAFDADGTGEKLYVAGRFDTAGGIACDGLAVWDGTSWSAPTDLVGDAYSFGTFDDGDGRALFMGGSFSIVDGKASTNIARFADPCGLDLGLTRCTSLPNSTGQAARLRADGSASVAAESIDLQASRLPAGQTTLLFNGTDPVQAFVGDGVLCLTNNVKRMYPAGTSNGSGEYNVSVDFSAPYAVNFLPGTTLLFQGWYRDVPGGPAGFNTTDAVEITFRL